MFGGVGGGGVELKIHGISHARFHTYGITSSIKLYKPSIHKSSVDLLSVKWVRNHYTKSRPTPVQISYINIFIW